ncbi:MAG: VapC toxin family PIN domain ribonuclease [Chitinivibrionales bacterium]|nr:VapC toxin family PIN domain ribonuclease [Chitinivibrionales bacterium]
MVSLLDVNVLVALAWPNHLHHDRAHEWFGAHSHEGWATCPVTQCGFVRVSSNPAVFRDAVMPVDAARVLAAMTSHRHHRFWPCDLPFSDAVSACAGTLTGHRQVTDCYLLGLAVQRGGRLVTFDGGTAQLLDQEAAAGHLAVIAPTA